MAKINETLSDEAHAVLKKYQFGRSKANQGAALNSLLPEYWELLEIIEELSRCAEPIDEDYGLCILCSGARAEHDDKCPWKMAKKFFP